MKIAVLYGGISTEREVSIKTGKEIVNNLNKEKYEVIEIDIKEKKDILKLIDLKVDFVYIALHGIYGESGEIQALLDILDIPYSGSNMYSSSISINKYYTKLVAKDANVRVVDGKLIKKDFIPKFENLNLGSEIILKPNKGGSSLGVYFVKNEKDYLEAIESIFKIDDEILAERVIRGEEISVPIIGEKVFPTLKIEPLKGTFFDYSSKYEKGCSLEYVYEFEEELQNEINSFTKQVYKALNCKGFSRIDYIISDNKAYFLEINTLPGMTSNSLLPISTASKGYSYSETLDLLIKESM